MLGLIPDSTANSLISGHSLRHRAISAVRSERVVRDLDERVRGDEVLSTPFKERGESEPLLAFTQRWP